MRNYLKMADEDMLNTLYQYMKLVNPEEDISLAEYVTKYIFVNGPVIEFMRIYCKDKEIVAQVTDRMKLPSWFRKLFHYHKVTHAYATRKIPACSRGIFYRYYLVEVKDKDLFKTED